MLLSPKLKSHPLLTARMVPPLSELPVFPVARSENVIAFPSVEKSPSAAALPRTIVSTTAPTYPTEVIVC